MNSTLSPAARRRIVRAGAASARWLRPAPTGASCPGASKGVQSPAGGGRPRPGRACSGRAGRSGRAARPRRAGLQGGQLARQAEHPLDGGDRNSRPVTIAETGLPGRPISGVPPSRPGHQRLARAHRHPVEVERQAAGERGLLHQVEVADRGAAESDDQVGARGERRRRRRGSRRCRGRSAGAAPRRRRPRASP